MFVLRQLLIFSDYKLSKDQKAQLHKEDYDNLHRALLTDKSKVAALNVLSADEFFDLLVGQMRMF